MVEILHRLVTENVHSTVIHKALGTIINKIISHNAISRRIDEILILQSSEFFILVD